MFVGLRTFFALGENVFDGVAEFPSVKPGGIAVCAGKAHDFGMAQRAIVEEDFCFIEAGKEGIDHTHTKRSEHVEFGA